MKSFAHYGKILRRVAAQSWLPALAALAYTVWEFNSTPAATRTLAGFIKSWGATCFLIMWFTGQWFRTAKQIDDNEQFGNIRAGIDDMIALMKQKAEASEAEPEAKPEAPQSQVITVSGIPAPEAAPPYEEPIARVLEEIPKSPKGALLILGAEIEKELRALLWTSGWFQGVGKATITASVGHLVQLGVIPATVASSVKAFLEIRNPLMHGYGVTDDQVLRAIDIGLTILRAVLAIPLEEHRVLAADVQLFEDEAGTRVRQDVRGVLLENKNRHTGATRISASPTIRTNYRKGERVSWEWDMGKVVNQCWYRDPATGELTSAWLSSALFIGRPLDEIR